MTKKTPKKPAPAAPKLLENNMPKKPRTMSPAMLANMERARNGELRGGRPKGSRNKFSEKFIQDFAAHWEKNGTDALDACLKKDVGTYVNAASRLIPKDFNINMNDEAALDKLLDKFSSEQLRDLAAGLSALGASHRQKTIEGTARNVPDRVH